MSNSNIVKFKDKKGNSYPYLYIDSKSGIFYARKWDGKSMRSASLETTDFNTARSEVLEKALELMKEPALEKKRENLLFKDFYEMMIQEKIASNTSEATMSRIDVVWRLSLAPFWELILPEDVNQKLVTEFITWHKRKRPGVQFYNVFKYLGNIFSVMVESGHLPAINKPRLELPKDEIKQLAKQKGRYITDDEFLNILKHADSLTWLILSIGYCTGMRKMEIGSLETSRLKKIDGRFIIQLDTDDTKTGLAREIPLPVYLTPAIDEILNPKAQYLFPMKTDPKRCMSGQLIDKGWVQAKRLAKISGKMRFHDLRHTCASNLAKSGINPVIAVTMLGMSFVTYQKTYLKLTSKDLIIASETNADRLVLAGAKK